MYLLFVCRLLAVILFLYQISSITCHTAVITNISKHLQIQHVLHCTVLLAIPFNVLYTYSHTLIFITFDLICNMIMFVQNGFWTFRGDTQLALPGGGGWGGCIKFPNVFLQSPSIGLLSVTVSRL